MVKRGPIEVVDHAMDFWLQEMQSELKKKEDDISKMRISERIHLGVKTRLELEVPYKKVWPQAMALGAQPQNVMNTGKQIHAISDEIWF